MNAAPHVLLGRSLPMLTATAGLDEMAASSTRTSAPTAR
jgi:hypothetical protein